MLIELIITEQGRSYRWAESDPQGRWLARPEEGDRDALASALLDHNEPVTLIVPGDMVALTRLNYDEKERRHLRQLVPYQLEDLVIGDVDNLHVALSTPVDGKVTVAYLEEELFAELIEDFKTIGIELGACYPNFQRMAVAENQWVICLTGNSVMAHHANGLGFSCPRGMSKLILEDFLAEPEAAGDETISAVAPIPLNVHLYGDNDKALSYLEARLPEHAKKSVTLHQQAAPAQTLSSAGITNLCQGAYAKAIPVGKIWRFWRPALLAGVAAVVAAFAVNIFEGYHFQSQQQQLKEKISEQYRTVIPRGPMGRDPVGNLKKELGVAPTKSDPSQVVYMLSEVAPLLKAQSVDVQRISYNSNTRALLISIEADAFNVIEQVRQEIEKAGLSAESRGSSSKGDKYQARLSIVQKGKS